MADFDAPSFSLGLDCDPFDSEPQITPVTKATVHSSSNQFPLAYSTFKDEDDEFETLVVDDSEPECPDSHPNLNRLRRGVTIGATSSSPVPTKDTAEMHSTAVIDDEDVDLLSSPKDKHTDSDDPYVNNKRKGSDSNSISNRGNYDDLPQHVNKKTNVSNSRNDFPKAYHYFSHDDLRIQELVRCRLPNFSPLGNMLNIDLEQTGTSKIDYMGQFSFNKIPKQAAKTIKNKKSSISRKNSRKLETEDMSQGWVNPKLCVDKVTTKGSVKTMVRSARQTAGHWFNGSDGKKVYVGKSGQELTGRVAYIQYKKDSGLGFKKVKRKSVTK